MSNIDDMMSGIQDTDTLPSSYTALEQDIFGPLFDWKPEESVAIHYGNMAPSGQHSGSITDDQIDADLNYPGNDILFNQPLILSTKFRNFVDIRYKSDYFPVNGAPKDVRYALMEDESQEAVIEFPTGFISPPQPGRLLLRTALVTVARNNQHHLHVHKFQLDNHDASVPDQNPFFTSVTEEHFRSGEIRIKLVPIKTRQKEWRDMISLPLFDGIQTSTDQETQCKSKKDLEQSYQLGRVMFAFTLGYADSQNQFIAFTNTTVFSDEIVDKSYLKKQPSEEDDIVCPNCSYHISLKRTKNERKRLSNTNSKSSSKKRSKQ